MVETHAKRIRKTKNKCERCGAGCYLGRDKCAKCIAAETRRKLGSKTNCVTCGKSCWVRPDNLCGVCRATKKRIRKTEDKCCDSCGVHMRVEIGDDTKRCKRCVRGETQCGECGATFIKKRSGPAPKRCPPCKDRYNALMARRRRKATPEKYDAHLRRKYGIGRREVEALIAKQDNRCGICERELDRGSGNLTSACVDHCHSTNKIRGILCGRCNTALGSLGDNLDGLERARRYLLNAEEA